ncbi:hypothetical protein [Paenibacillus ginsengarvi]|nr:hypothetical protein [Paenibacillus ginsengarvi]
MKSKQAPGSDCILGLLLPYFDFVASNSAIALFVRVWNIDSTSSVS